MKSSLRRLGAVGPDVQRGKVQIDQPFFGCGLGPLHAIEKDFRRPLLQQLLCGRRIRIGSGSNKHFESKMSDSKQLFSAQLLNEALLQQLLHPLSVAVRQLLPCGVLHHDADSTSGTGNARRGLPALSHWLQRLPRPDHTSGQSDTGGEQQLRRQLPRPPNGSGTSAGRALRQWRSGWSGRQGGFHVRR